MIAGGGRIGTALATKLEPLYSLKVIEKNKNTAKLISETLSSAVVLSKKIHLAAYYTACASYPDMVYFYQNNTF